MKKTFAIDIPFLCLRHELSFSVDDCLLLLDVIKGIKENPRCCIVFREHIMGLLNYSIEEMWKISNDITCVESCPYTPKPENAILRSTPVMTDKRLDTEVNDEMLHMLYKLHNDIENNYIIYIVPSSRWHDGGRLLQTEQDRHTKGHKVICVENRSDFNHYLDSCRPGLDQKKHKADSGMLNGMDVSPFSAYDVHNEEKAKELLLQAYDDYQGCEDFPKYLFTWDHDNECYVEFRHSGRGQYHGMDVTTDRERNRIPQYVKDKYRK